MTQRVCNVLFLCTGNSARSIIAEAVLEEAGKGRFRAYSAGSHPNGKVNPVVAAHLESVGLSTASARSKSWDEFATADAPTMDLVITVCDAAAGEACPVWPGAPARAHWGAPDPAAHMDDPAKARAVAREVHRLMQRRIAMLIALPVETLDRATLQAEANAIAERTRATLQGA
ncbi:MAG: arsenate reductase ArsC [Burkholderiales bacterium]